MTIGSRAVPYLERLLNDQDVQEHLGQAWRSSRDVYHRARGKSAAAAVEDKKLRSRIAESIESTREAWAAVRQPPPPPKRRRLLPLLALAAAGVLAVIVVKQRAGRARASHPISSGEVQGSASAAASENRIAEEASPLEHWRADS